MESNSIAKQDHPKSSDQMNIITIVTISYRGKCTDTTSYYYKDVHNVYIHHTNVILIGFLVDLVTDGQ